MRFQTLLINVFDVLRSLEEQSRTIEDAILQIRKQQNHFTIAVNSVMGLVEAMNDQIGRLPMIKEDADRLLKLLLEGKVKI